MLPKGIVALLLLVFAIGYPALAQAGTQAGKLSQWPEVHLNVLVIDKSGQSQTALDKSSFHVFENGTERPLESISAGDAPVSLALLLDTSHSGIEEHTILTGVAAAVTRAMPPGSEVMAVRFADQAHLVLPFTPTNPFPLSFLNHLEWKGGTSLYDAIRLTEAYVAENAHYARSALVVLSDGMDDHSKSNLEDTMPSLQWPGAPVLYFVRLPGESGVRGYKRFSELAVKLLVLEGGGLSVVPKKHPDPAALGAKIAALIRSQYVFTFETTDPASDGKSHKLAIRLTEQSKKLVVHALPSYSAPSGYWIDPSTGLMWAAKDNGKDITWDKAMKYCRNLSLAGYFDWRLPSLDELQGIYDGSGFTAPHPKDVTPALAGRAKGGLLLTGAREWSSTRVLDDRGHRIGFAWQFDFPHGKRWRFDPLGYNGSLRALCVRGSTEIRSGS